MIGLEMPSIQFMEEQRLYRLESKETPKHKELLSEQVTKQLREVS